MPANTVCSRTGVPPRCRAVCGTARLQARDLPGEGTTPGAAGGAPSGATVCRKLGGGRSPAPLPPAGGYRFFLCGTMRWPRVGEGGVPSTACHTASSLHACACGACHEPAQRARTPTQPPLVCTRQACPTSHAWRGVHLVMRMRGALPCKAGRCEGEPRACGAMRPACAGNGGVYGNWHIRPAPLHEPRQWLGRAHPLGRGGGLAGGWGGAHASCTHHGHSGVLSCPHTHLLSRHTATELAAAPPSTTPRGWGTSVMRCGCGCGVSAPPLGTPRSIATCVCMSSPAGNIATGMHADMVCTTQCCGHRRALWLQTLRARARLRCASCVLPAPCSAAQLCGRPCGLLAWQSAWPRPQGIGQRLCGNLRYHWHHRTVVVAD